ncbi:MAG: hypothetical protein IJU70_05330 [Lentisphaeria bacterium]|nr:hypothetical protein [Lentisphaeria bacterium]
MVTLVCPCCGENYSFDGDIPDGQKFYCAKCRRKHICLNGSLIPFIRELPGRDNMRRAECPYCANHIAFDDSVRGEYFCPSCGRPFYVSDERDSHISPELDELDPVPQIRFTEESLEPVREIQFQDVETPETQFQGVVFPEEPVQTTGLLAFEDSGGENIRHSPEPPRIKIGLPRSRSGLSGVFIGIAEKLCGN